MPTLWLFLAVAWVGLQSLNVAFLCHTLSFFKTMTIIVDDNTIVLDYKSALAKIN